MQLDLRSTGRRKRNCSGAEENEITPGKRKTFTEMKRNCHTNLWMLLDQAVCVLEDLRSSQDKSEGGIDIWYRSQHPEISETNQIRPKITAGWLAHTYPPSLLNGWWILLHCSSSERRWPRTNSQGSSRRSIRSWMNWSMLDANRNDLQAGRGRSLQDAKRTRSSKETKDDWKQP